MPRTDFDSVDDYLEAQPAQVRRALAQVRAAIRKALPRAAEAISYQIPVYKLDGRMVLYFAGFARHYSIYPASAALVEALGKAVAGRLHSKATIRFAFDEPVPARLIARIAKLRAAEVSSAGAAGRAKRPATKSSTAGARTRSASKKQGATRGVPRRP